MFDSGRVSSLTHYARQSNVINKYKFRQRDVLLVRCVYLPEADWHRAKQGEAQPPTIESRDTYAEDCCVIAYFKYICVYLVGWLY